MDRTKRSSVGTSSNEHTLPATMFKSPVYAFSELNKVTSRNILFTPQPLAITTVDWLNFDYALNVLLDA
jgi:hypothetical protein